MRLALTADVDHDNNVLASLGDYQPIKRCGAGIGKLQPPARSAPPQMGGMSLVVAIHALHPTSQPR
jgi:hypothetical protein